MIQLTKTPILPNCQVPNGFFGITINYKHLVSVFSGGSFFLREREKIFCTYSGPWECVKSFDCILIQLPTFPFPMEKSRNSSVIATRLPPGELEKILPTKKNLLIFKFF